ncbi:MAG: LacI family DNA-binding transcriptional regulator [Eubacteriales bacterium]|nr:LacI family DNA-binding transcriptional regulator [Eubacteriales bacterium]
MSSIREVARLAGVSPATVSRVMNGTANVNEEKRERVLRAISETGFVPNEVARSLFRKSARIIGLVLPDIENPFFTQLADAIEKKADSSGYRVILYNTRNDIEKEKMALQMMISMNADGIIFSRSNEQLQPFMEESPIPVVVTDTVFSGGHASAYVHCDFYQGGRMATEYLMECGCHKIVCMKGPQTHSSAKSRYEGYRDVCLENNLEERTVETDYSFNMGLTAAEELLEKYPDADGIVACNDMVAISAYKVLYKNHISVPDQVQIIGFDDIFLSTLLTPELTTITQPIKAIGEKAAELIIHSDVQAMNMEKYIFPVSLVERETTRKKNSC